MMAKAPAAAPPVEAIDPADPFGAWEAEALATASEAIAAGETMSHGAILPANPALEYRVIDGELPKNRQARFRANR